jgi:hypothetical protein
MGIDGFWIGYEGTRSNYAKQQGRPVEEIITEFRQHGITVLTSMIVGFDYQTPEVIAAELAGLLKLQPALAQFLIYGPVPGTPFYDRIVKSGQLADRYTADPDRFYRDSDGFQALVKHPTMTAEEIEAIQRRCFDEDFRVLGPSIYRVLDALALGYATLRDSPNPVLRKKADFYARELRKSYPIFLAGKLLGPNAAVRAWIARLEQRVHGYFGQPTLTQHLLSVVALTAALWTWVTMRFDFLQHPRLTRTTYRMHKRRPSGENDAVLERSLAAMHKNSPTRMVAALGAPEGS